ncbi:ribonuclease H-like domain-containing protein [Tanacetum coccineum]
MIVDHTCLKDLTMLILNADSRSPKGGKITRKGKIRTGKLDFEHVYFVKELKFNIFSVSQMCDKKNNVLFTETECLVLSPDFKLLDESQVLLKVPRQNNMYSFDLKNVVPSGGLTCLIIKATIDEFNLWHRRLGHINFKTKNKLVRGNLVRGLPLKLFENDHTYVACQKGKKHKASYPLGKFDGKADEGFLIGYSINSKAFRVFNTRTRKVEENLHINFLENKPNVAGNGPEWLFDIDSLIKSMNYEPITTGNQTNNNSEISQSTIIIDVNIAGPSINTASENTNTGSSNINTASPIPNDPSMHSLEATGIFSGTYDNEDVGAEADLNNLATTMNVSPIPITRIHKDHPKDQIIGDINSATQTRRMTKITKEHAMIEAMQEELLQFKLQKVWTLIDLAKGKRAIGTNINSNSNNNTNETDNTAYGVSAAHTQSNLTTGDNLNDAVICAFLASQPNSPQMLREDLEQIDPDNLEEMDLKWEMAMLTIRARRFIKRTGMQLDVNGQRVGFDRSKLECYNCHKYGHFSREYKAPRNQENRGRENNRRTVTVETPTENALVAQDEIRGYD